MTVLVLARERDASADRLVRALQRRDSEVFRADLRWFPSELSVAARLVRGRWDGVLTTRHRAVRLDAVRAVWCRDPGSFGFASELSVGRRAQAFDQARLGLGGLLACLADTGVLWANDPDRARDADYPPRQLAVAAYCGLVVPRTLVTNDPLSVHDFARSGERGVRGRSFGRSLDYTGNLDELADVALTAHLFSERVETDHIIRVIMVAGRLFPVALRPGRRFDPMVLPVDVGAALRRYQARLALPYLVVDLAATTAGQHVFLRSTTGARYGRLESATDIPVTESIAELLTDTVR
ncbi:ATP-grasp domain-containing protein [Pseudonocardia spinosispora]|uniref:ATP-grasp domain-containing protein n=1 Tax=Pseudonocardia spinosispora TaxID=103441 RepID=UPI000425F765|nr:hypothetical protein [Pseudonocardia spinosispora]